VKFILSMCLSVTSLCSPSNYGLLCLRVFTIWSYCIYFVTLWRAKYRRVALNRNYLDIFALRFIQFSQCYSIQYILFPTTLMCVQNIYSGSADFSGCFHTWCDLVVLNLNSFPPPCLHITFQHFIILLQTVIRFHHQLDVITNSSCLPL